MRVPSISGIVVLGLAALVGCTGGNGSQDTFRRTDLVSDQAGVGSFTDPDLVNAWGLASGPTTYWWVSDNGTGRSTLYDGQGQPQSEIVGGAVDLTAPDGTAAAPTGVVFNPTSDFVVTGPATGTGTAAGASGPATFLFATEQGMIFGWNSTANERAGILAVDRSSEGKNYKGLALLTANGQNRLYAADFANGTIDVYGPDFTPLATTELAANAFQDSNVPSGMSPFNVAAIGNRLYVAWAELDQASGDEVAGDGMGYVDVFDPNGTLVDTVASGGRLNAPWGIAKAPGNFGSFADAILVGNFGDGRITAYDQDTWDELGQLQLEDGSEIQIDGLWGLAFGNGGNSGTAETLYFAAGPNGEQHGLLGSIVRR